MQGDKTLFSEGEAKTQKWGRGQKKPIIQVQVQ